MKKNLTEIVFILDRSGSMSGLESDTIGGFNSLIEKQKKRRARPLFPRSSSAVPARSSTTGCPFRRCPP